MTLQEQAELKLMINGTQVKTELDIIADKIDTLREKQSQFTRSDKEWQNLNKEIKGLTATYKTVEERMDINLMKTSQLTKYQRELRLELGNAVGTDRYEAVRDRLTEVNTRMAQLRSDQQQVTTEGQSMWQQWGGQIKATFTGIVAAFSFQTLFEKTLGFIENGISRALEASDAFGDMAKSTGMSSEELDKLDESLQQLDTRTAQESLRQMVVVGGQIGIAKDEMEGFVKSVDMAAVALGDEFSGGVEVISKELGTVQKLFKETKDMEAGKAINDIGSAINELGAAGLASGPYITDFTKRVGQLGDLAPEITEVLGLAASMEEMGLTSEIAASGISNILLTGAKGAGEFAKQIGVSEKQLREWINTDPNKFLLELAKSFEGMPADKMATRLAELKIKSNESVKVMASLSSNVGLVTEKQDLANQAFTEGTSLIAEFEKKNTTAAAEVEKMKKEINLKAEAMGNALLPALLKTGAALLSFIEALIVAPKWILQNKELFVGLGVALISLNASNISAAASALYHASVEKGRAIYTTASATAQRLLNAAMTANPIGLVIAATAALAAILITAYKNVDWFRAGVNATWAGLKTLVSIIWDTYKAFLSFDIGKVWDNLKNGWKQVGDATAKAYTETMADANNKVTKDNNDHRKKEQTAEEKKIKELEKLNKELLDNKSKDNSNHRAEEEKKAAEAAAKEVEENKKLIKKLDDIWTDAIEDEVEKNTVKLMQKYEEELEFIEKSKVSSEEKAELELKLHGKLMADIKKLNDKATEEEKKRIKEIDKIWAESIEDETERHVVKLMQKYEADVEYVEENIKGEKERTEAILELNKKLISDIELIDKKAADEKEKKRKEEQVKVRAWTKQVADWAFEHKKEELEALIEAEKEHGDKRYQLRVMLLQTIYKKELEEIEKWKVDQLAAVGDDASKKAVIINEANERTLAAKRKLNTGLNGLDAEREAAAKAAAEKEAKIMEAVFDTAFKMFEKLSTAATAEKDKVAKAWEDTAMNVFQQVAKGNYMGAIVSAALGLMDVVMAKWKKEVEAIEKEVKRVEDALQRVWEASDVKISAIQEVYDSLGSLYGNIAFPDLNMEEEMDKQLQAIQAVWDKYEEMKRGDAGPPYVELIEKETQYAELVLKNYEAKMAAEEKLFNEQLSNIQAVYDKNMLLNNQAYDAETLAVKEHLSNQLLALITNEESKSSVVEEYAGKRSFIMQQFAAADLEITDDMDQSQIDNINRQIAARAAALAQLESWYNSELDTIINAEGQKRKEYSKTELLKNEAAERLNQLAIENQAKEIQLELEKNIAIEDENARHNAELKRLGKEKDDALAVSFGRLKDLMVTGYDEIRDAAFRAYQQGIITAEKYNEILGLLGNIAQFDPSVAEDYVPATRPSTTPEHVYGPRSYGNGGDFPMDNSYFENAGVLGGLRHGTPEGGNWVINPRTGKLLAKMEAGEFIRVYSRDMTRRMGNKLDKVNASGIANTGVPMFASGGYMGMDGVSYSSGGGYSGRGYAGHDISELTDYLGKWMSNMTVELAGIREGQEPLKYLFSIAETSKKTSDKPVLSVRQISKGLNDAGKLEARSGFG